ncbi:hypothetical protein PR202_gb22156 [Eleusine coracana subsp. coracana]|uniref:HhH-GPD domain-containing protein n=1 Tax=Eleusine coracana subsp. coracana TaxID=191504 RepID=A0AAV5FFH8_ELECO|nr:hypothetical protein PR202_gb22156 [Eleusine coracana subsp. coracana]
MSETLPIAMQVHLLYPARARDVQLTASEASDPPGQPFRHVFLTRSHQGGGLNEQAASRVDACGFGSSPNLPAFGLRPSASPASNRAKYGSNLTGHIRGRNMQKGPGQVLHESHGINLCFQNSSVPFQMDSSIDPGAGNVTPPVTFEKAYANSQAVRDGAVAAEGVETNGKSVQKPKRKKHRPKVIKEVQSAKSQKPKTPNPPKEKGNQHTGKRKYVRRKGLNPPATQPPTGGTDIQTRAEPGATQRCLNFDREDTHGNTDLVSQIQVTQMPTVSENHLTSISGVERSSTQVSCHWGGTNSSFSSVDPMADSCELRVDSMPKRAAFDLNNSVINQMPISYSNLMESSDQFLHYDSRGRVQNNQLLDFHPGTPVSFTYLNSSVNQMQNNLANLDQYIGASQSSTEQSPRHDQLVHLIRMFENQAAPAQRSERVSVRDAFNPEACLREGAMINQMAQCYRPQDSIFAPPRHIERDAMSGDMNEFSAKNDDLKCATNSNYRIGAGFEFGGSPDFSDVLATSKKREHNAINGHTISFGMDFDNTNKTRLFYNDHLSTSSQTSYFPETCKRMRSDNLSSQLNSAMGNFSSSSVCSGSWNTNKVSAIKPGACTLADVQRLMAREKSRASQRMIDLGISENNMAQLHAKPDLQNIVDKNCFALHGREYGSFTGQHIQSPGCTMNPLGESTIPRNGAYQPQSCEIRPSQHHSSDSISLPAKWCTYVSTAHTQLPNSTENPSMENYIQGNDIHQLHSLENIAVDKSVLFSEPHKTSTQDDTVNYYSTAASSDAQVRTTNAEIVKPFSQPPRDGNCHPESSRLTTEAKSSEKPKVRGRPRKDAKTNGTPEDRNSTGKKNVGRAKKRVSSKGASSEFLKTDSITCASEPSTATIPRMIITESEKYGETTLNVLKASDRDNYCDTSKQAHKGFNSQDTTPSVDPLDAIIQKIKILSINRPDAVAAEIPQNALVPYEGGYGALVPFERKVKKSRSRAKVNIDPVTTLMWNLLMGPDMSDGAEGLDKDKEKWLEEERRVFRGRVDSFIARDRRFSPWKGSVVDSVVGVFLTQNVSDHLSSSAFMAVAAKFPAKSEVPEEHVADISHTPHQGQNDSCPGLFGDSTKLQGKLSVEEISDIRSLITTDDNEESNSNELIGSSSGCGANHDPKNIANGNAGSSEYHGGSRLPVSGVSCFNYMDQSFYTGSDRVNLSSVTQSEASQAASSMDNISKTKLTNPPSHLLYRISGSEFLNRLVRDHGSVDLEWLRDVQPDKAKDYLLSIRGLGLKSVECVRLLTLHHMAFPVDTNVGRICVRLGWVPLQPLPESLQLHLLEMYPMLEQIQKYLWPRLCKLDQRTLYELHYQMITFGKVFVSKSKPNCNSCPMRAECKHFASAFASARLALPGPQEKSLVTSEDPNATGFCHQTYTDSRTVGQLEWNANHPRHAISGNHQPIIEEPPSPEPEAENAEMKEDAIEDFCYEDPDEIPRIDLNIEQFTQNLKSYMQANNLEIEQADMSKALVAITPAAASIPIPKLKNVSRLRTEHHVYELPDEHPLLEGVSSQQLSTTDCFHVEYQNITTNFDLFISMQLEPREQDDPSPYLLSIWTPGKTIFLNFCSYTCCSFC